MNWKPYPDEARQVSADFHYGVYRHTNGEWKAWLRMPVMRRIGDWFDNEQQAKAACEQHAKEMA